MGRTYRWAELLGDIVSDIERFCVLPEYAAPLIAAWALHAWAHDLSDISPIMALTSPEKRCGKSTALDVIHALTPKAETTANISEAVLFRLIDRHKPTLLIDEADTFLDAREEMRGMLNAGQKRAGAHVWRCSEIEGEIEPVKFSVWGPKAIAMIGDLPDTIEDRAIYIRLERNTCTVW